MGQKVNRTEALIYKKMLLEKDAAKRELLGKQLVEELKKHLADDYTQELETAAKARISLESIPGFGKDIDTSMNVRKKLAASLTDDEFVEWLQSGGAEMPKAINLSSEEMDLLHGGVKTKYKYQEISIITCGIGCLITWGYGNCSWG